MSGDCPNAVQGCPGTVRMLSGDVRGLPACCQGCPGTVRMLSGNVRVLSACCPGMSGITVRMLSGDGRFASMPSMFDDDDDDDRDTKRDKSVHSGQTNDGFGFYFNAHTKKSAKLRLHIYASSGNTASVQDKYDTIGKKSHSDDGCVREYDDVYTEDASFMQFDAD